MADLETTLQLLTRHGKPCLMQFDDGTWHCKVAMRVTAIGAAFTVSSAFNCSGPLAAADECLDRVYAMLREFSASDAKAITHG